MKLISPDQFLALFIPRDSANMTAEETKRIDMFCNAFPEYDIALKQAIEKPYVSENYFLGMTIAIAKPFVDKLLLEMFPEDPPTLDYSPDGSTLNDARPRLIAGAVIAIEANPTAYRKLLKRLIACKRVYNNIAVKDGPDGKWLLFFS